MANIKFCYLYRDGANYKNFGTVVFDNPCDISNDKLEKLIRDNLISGEYFYADKWLLPDVHFDTWDNQTDHTFHEFEMVEYTSECADFFVSLNKFADAVRNFNPMIEARND